MRTEARWMLLGVAVISVLAVAIWPRSGTSEQSGAHALHEPAVATDSVTPQESAAVPAPVAPCPQPSGAPAVDGVLVGVQARCLGSDIPIDVGRALAGQPTLINLWASWCAPCREEIPVLDAYAQAPDAIRVVGVNVQDKQNSALSLLADLGAHYPSFGDGDDVQKVLPAPPVLPLSFVVRGDGSVVRITSTPVFHDVQQVRDAVAAVIS